MGVGDMGLQLAEVACAAAIEGATGMLHLLRPDAAIGSLASPS